MQSKTELAALLHDLRWCFDTPANTVIGLASFRLGVPEFYCNFLNDIDLHSVKSTITAAGITLDIILTMGTEGTHRQQHETGQGTTEGGAQLGASGGHGDFGGTGDGDDDEFLVRASAVLKSQGPESWSRGRPGPLWARKNPRSVRDNPKPFDTHLILVWNRAPRSPSERPRMIPVDGSLDFPCAWHFRTVSAGS